MIYSRIVGTGSHLPEKVLTNFDLEKLVDTSDAWIRDRTGIERRHIAAEGETTVDLAEHAARRALEAAGLRPEDVDFIAFGTTTPDLVFPNCGVLLQGRLGCRGGPAFSVETACSGFMYALSIADKYVRCGEAKRALVVGSETLSRITDWTRRSTAILFADGAGAVVLGASEEPGILSTHLHADGHYKDMLYCGSGVSKGFGPDKVKLCRFPWWAAKCSRSPSQRWARRWMKRWRPTVWTARPSTGWCPHQANMRIIQAIARKLDLPMERVVLTVQDHGNTSAASVPLALDGPSATGASSAGICCCWKRSVVVLPGVPRWSATESTTLRPKENAAHEARRSVSSSRSMASYFEIERLNILSIFSLVASTADWLA